ncbi:hypothetical protein [Nonomuraea sediminis]|nr:hypothetical protein [Nonomuraea sediminis]
MPELGAAVEQFLATIDKANTKKAYAIALPLSPASSVRGSR